VRRLSLGLTRLRPALPAVVICALLALVPYPTCLLRLILGIPCPACGLTRATLALLRLDLGHALLYQPLAPALLGLTVITVALAFTAGDALWRRVVSAVLGASGAALIVVWALRFAGLFGGPVAY
jgi:hypothetical protein